MRTTKEEFLLKKERGQSLMELALTITFIMILIAGVVDLGRAFFTYISLRDAAQEGALYGSLEPADCGGIEKRIRSTSTVPVNLNDATRVLVAADIAKVGSSSSQCSLATNPCAGDEVRVTVTFKDFDIATPFLGTLVGRQKFDISASVSDTILTPYCSP